MGEAYNIFQACLKFYSIFGPYLFKFDKQSMMSSSSLMGLVNQLHNMESSFTQVLMEATMKLSALTDASVFLLFETPEGRRFCGKRQLCDTFLSQGAATLQVRPNLVDQRQSFVPAQNSNVNYKNTLADRKRASDNQDVHPNFMHKQFRLSETHYHSSHSESLGNCLSDTENSGNKDVVFVDVKKEEAEEVLEMANIITDQHLPLEGLQNIHPDPSKSADDFLDIFARKATVDQMSLPKKLNIMKTLVPDVILKPGAAETEEYLIFQKVCYEFCRACALECPQEEQDVDSFFDVNFNKFASIFPRLNSNADVLYQMRLLTKRSYKQYLKTRGKRDKDHAKIASFFM